MGGPATSRGLEAGSKDLRVEAGEQMLPNPRRVGVVTPEATLVASNDGIVEADQRVRGMVGRSIVADRVLTALDELRRNQGLDDRRQ